MSWINYVKAIDLIETNNLDFELIGNQSDLLIEKAELSLGIKFSKIYHLFLKNYGAGRIDDFEFLGLVDDKLVNHSKLDAISNTLNSRKENGLPNNYLIIYDRGTEFVYGLDFNKLNEENEPAVVCIYLESDWSDEFDFDVYAKNFGDFLLEFVEGELEYEEPKLKITIDVSKIKTNKELHLLLKEKLEFPDFYGENWDAFLDTITGIVELPDKIEFVGWSELERRLPEDSKIMKECLLEHNQEFPNWKCEILLN